MRPWRVSSRIVVAFVIVILCPKFSRFEVAYNRSCHTVWASRKSCCIVERGESRPRQIAPRFGKSAPRARGVVDSIQRQSNWSTTLSLLEIAEPGASPNFKCIFFSSLQKIITEPQNYQFSSYWKIKIGTNIQNSWRRDLMRDGGSFEHLLQVFTLFL